MRSKKVKQSTARNFSIFRVKGMIAALCSIKASTDKFVITLRCDDSITKLNAVLEEMKKTKLGDWNV